MSSSRTTPLRALVPAEAAARLTDLTVVDVRTSAEFASGHLPDAHHVPLDRLGEAVPALRAAAAARTVLVVCASGNRSARACAELAAAGVPAASLAGGTAAWAAEGRGLERPAGGRRAWPMERQVRFTAGGLVLAGLAAGRRRPAARLLSAGIGAGLVFSAVSGTCGLAALLARLPHNRRGTGSDLPAVLAALHERARS